MCEHSFTCYNLGQIISGIEIAFVIANVYVYLIKNITTNSSVSVVKYYTGIQHESKVFVVK